MKTSKVFTTAAVLAMLVALSSHASFARAETTTWTALRSPYETNGGDIMAFDADGNKVQARWASRSGSGNGTGLPFAGRDAWTFEYLGSGQQTTVVKWGRSGSADPRIIGGPIMGAQVPSGDLSCNAIGPWPFSTLPIAEGGCFDNLDIWSLRDSEPGTWGINMPLTVNAGTESEPEIQVFDRWEVDNVIVDGKCNAGDMGVLPAWGGRWSVNVGVTTPVTRETDGPEYRVWADVNNNLGLNGTIHAHYARVSPDTSPPLFALDPFLDCTVVEQGADLVAEFSCSEPAGLGSGVATCEATDRSGPVANGGLIDTSVIGIHTFTLTTTDNAGNERTKTVQYTVEPSADETPPNVTPTVSGTQGANDWYTSDVTVSWTVDDPESDVTTPPCTDTDITSDTTGQLVTCDATSAGGTTTESVTVKRDATPPAVQIIGGPVDDATYVFGQVPAAPTCSASDATSGVDGDCSIVGYSSSPGTHTIMASATDLAGNTAEVTRSYTVSAWTITGFYAPIKMDGIVNQVKAGRVVPVKFEIFAGDIELTDVTAISRLSFSAMPTIAGATVDEVDETVSTASPLRYDTESGEFIMNWKTPRPGTWKLTLTTVDGSQLYALFQTR